jgi:hypothetical protein
VHASGLAASEEENDMAFCSKCGSRLNDGSSFCTSCGAPLGAAPRPAAAAPPPPPPPRAQENYSYAPPPPRPQANYAYSASGEPAPGLVPRITNILTKPKEEWPVIAGESATISSLYTGYIVLLAAIPVIASFIKMSIIGTTVFVTTVRVGIATGLIGAIVQYVLTLGGIYLSAFIIEKLAPNFQSEGDTVQAMKLVAYAYTPAWVAGVFNLLPIIGILGLLAGGIYSIYLFYIGLPIVMRTPQDKVIVYMIVAAVVIFVIYLIIGMVVGAITAASLMGTGAFSF